MKIGVAFPTTEIGNKPADIGDFVRGVEDMGYDYLTCIDHVIQGAQVVADDWRSYYTLDNAFHELREEFEGWRGHGATHVTVRTMTAGYTSVSEHLKALEEARNALPGS